MSLDNFGLEWDLHRKTQYDSKTGKTYTKQSFQERTGFRLDELRGRLVLEAGCGSGRYLEIIHSYDGVGIGVDGSRSVFAARRMLPGEVDLIQADLYCPPFREAVFDKVFSLGVIHHTPNPRCAFLALAGLVRPGGELAISVYSNEGVVRRYANAIGSMARGLVSFVGLSALYRICQQLASIPIPRVLLVRPYLRPSDLKLSPALVLNFFLPFLSTVSDRDWRTLDTFDYLSPKFQSKHTYAEVVNWFSKSGFGDVLTLGVPVSVKGRKALL